MIAHRIRSSLQALTRWTDRYRVWLLALLMVWLALLLCVFARAKPFWHDEVYTILTAQLPVTTFWRSSLDGVDLSPPLNTLVTHWLQRLTGVGPIATRIPAMTGLLVACLLLFVTVRRRTNAIAGLAAALIPCFTPAWQYGFEARGYGLTLGFFAAALYGWSAALDDRRPSRHLAVMSAALAAGVWTHYFAFLAFLPIVVGEAVRQGIERRFRRAPWIALSCAVLAVLPLWPLMSAAAGQRHTFWTRVERHDLPQVYAFVLGDVSSNSIALLVLVVVIIAEAVRRRVYSYERRRLEAPIVAACAACLALPAAGAWLGGLAGAFTERYVVMTVVGLAFAAAQLLWWLTPDNGAGETIGAAALVWMLLTFTGHTLANPPVWRNPIDYHPLLTRVLQASAEPVAMTGGVAFLGVWYSLPEPARERVIYLADPDAQLRLQGSDTVDRTYLALAGWTTVPVAAAADFSRAHDRFLLYSFGAGWTEQALRAGGAVMNEQARVGGAALYELRTKN